MEKEMIIIDNKSDNSKMEVELITYLIDNDKNNKYIVYSKGEVTGVEGDEIIYISRIVNDGETPRIEEIVDNDEWASVQSLLKAIANA